MDKNKIDENWRCKTIECIACVLGNKELAVKVFDIFIQQLPEIKIPKDSFYPTLSIDVATQRFYDGLISFKKKI